MTTKEKIKEIADNLSMLSNDDTLYVVNYFLSNRFLSIDQMVEDTGNGVEHMVSQAETQDMGE